MPEEELKKIIDISFDNIFKAYKFIIVKNKRYYFYCDLNPHHRDMYLSFLRIIGNDKLNPCGGGILLEYTSDEYKPNCKTLLVYGRSRNLGKFPVEITAELLEEYMQKDEKNRLRDHIV